MKSLTIHIFRPFLISVVIGMSASVAALLLFSLIMYTLHLPDSFSYPLGLASLAAGCFTAGRILGGKKRHSGIKQGLLCGTAMFLLCLLGGFIFGTVSFWGVLAKLLICLATGISGGVSGVNSRIKH